MPDYLNELKARLDITWLDESGTSKLLSICKNAEAWLSHRAGTTLSFSVDGDRNLLELLYNCVLYMRSNSLHEFEQNYFGDLDMLRAYVHVQTMEAEEEGDSDD